ncbi:hypothetical protein GCK72_020387 [Caenorhabditis remanei]|uniref:F-box domain-containing protein n=1 Tax=Caenorhabditis remanei TaxID=31234 RepID=A0A6A5GFD7_CAERE|nr:hypothetical protein GCK72_020387 [Caenorhabditis remanei]KAF1753830.1 hypothetical protein GCK72_020387 [Caenorhabditis remanei]
MTRPPPDSQIDLRALILYDDYQRKTAGKSYENYEKLCDTIGEKAISCDVYKYWFNRYPIEECLTRSESDGSNIPATGIRWCILSDVISGKCAEKSIDDLCEVFDELKIDKEDHDYWFKRFGNGHLFKRVTFSDLPNEIIAEIVGKCDSFRSYLTLRNVSRRLRAIVDSSKPAFSCITVYVGEDSIEQ